MQLVFEHLPLYGDCKTVKTLSNETGLWPKKVSDICCRLQTHGFVTRPSLGCYKLTKAGVEARDAGKQMTSGPNKPLTGQRKPPRNRQKLKVWKALRMVRRATVQELMATTGLSGEKAHHNVRQYLNHLSKAGYVQKLPRRSAGSHLTSNGFKVYFLLNDTGPDAPVYSVKYKRLYDPNLNTHIDLGDAN